MNTNKPRTKSASGPGSTGWSDVCSVVQKIEKQRLKSIVELGSIKSLHSALQDLPSDKVAENIPNLKRHYSESFGMLDKQARHINVAMTKLTYLISLRESEESAAAAMSVDPQPQAPRRVWPDDLLHGDFPVYRGKGPLPSLCGAIPPPDNYIIPDNNPVAAWKKDMWILAVVVKSVREKQGSIRYEVEDVDPEAEAEGAQKRFQAAQRNVIPLPLTIPDPSRPRPPESEYPADSHVLALWPGSTCFYAGRVLQPPSKRKATNDYLIEFAGEGDQPPSEAPTAQQFVIPFRKRSAKGQKD